MMELMRRHGLCRRMRAIGRNAVKVMDLLTNSLREVNVSKPALLQRSMSTVILFDRETDLVTPLMSQFTTEGVFDDAFDLAAEAGYVYWNDKGARCKYSINTG